MSAPRFQESPDHRYAICNLDGVPISLLSRIASAKTLSLRRRQPSSAALTVPSSDPSVCLPYDDDDPRVECSNRVLKIWRRDFANEEGDPWTIRHAGIVMALEDDGDPDVCRTSFTSYDPWMFLFGRPVYNADGEIPADNSDIVVTDTGDQIVKTLIQRTIDVDGPCFVDIDTGTYETTASITQHFQAGMNVGEALQQLADSETLDIEFLPVHRTDGVLAVLNVYVRRGSDRPNARISFDRPPHSALSARRSIDGTPQQMGNDIRLYAGPGGINGAAAPVSDATSIAKYNRYVVIDFLTGFSQAQIDDLSAEELALRKNPREEVSLTPVPDSAPRPFEDYWIGDTIMVHMGQALRRAEHGLQRVDGLDLSIDDEDNERVDRLYVTPDGGA